MIDNYKLGSTIDKKITTRRSSGQPIVFAGSPAVEIYKNNVVTPTTAGVTLTSDFNGRSGLNHLRIVTTDAFYVAGTYQVVVSSGTVDGVSIVGEVIWEFSLSLDTHYPSPIDNADEVLKRDWNLVTGEATRSLINASRFSRNKVTISGSTLIVYKEDGVTPSFTAAVTFDANGNITSMTPI